MAKEYTWLVPSEVRLWRPLAKKRGVSKVSRSARGFTTAYLRAGHPDKLSQAWVNKRNNFVARHLAQMIKNNEPLFDSDGMPTDRHLALIMWAYSPRPSALGRRKP